MPAYQVLDGVPVWLNHAVTVLELNAAGDIVVSRMSATRIRDDSSAYGSVMLLVAPFLVHVMLSPEMPRAVTYSPWPCVTMSPKRPRSQYCRLEPAAL